MAKSTAKKSKEQTVTLVEGQSAVIVLTCEFYPSGYSEKRHEEIYDEWKHCVKEWLGRNEDFKSSYEGSLYLLDNRPPYGQFFLMYVFSELEAAKRYSVSTIFETMVDTFAGEFSVVSNNVSVYQSGEVPGGG